MFDLLFLAIPALGGLLLLVGSIYLWVQSRYGWYVAPAVMGLLSLLSILGMIAGGPGTDTAISWISALFWFALGLIVFSIVRKRASARS